tara:strand:- start:3264 stop:4307 length:1044 start_codon:yes stop_codon:yes gene_type:complete
MNRLKALALISLLGVIVGLYFTVNFFNIFLWDNTLFANSNQIIYIDSDDNFDSLMADLGPYLKSKDNFITAAHKKGYINRIKSGKYLLTPGMGNNKMINSLRSNAQIVKVTFNNQERLEILAGRIAKQIEADSLSLLKAFKEPSFWKDKAFQEETYLAMFLPNTYNFYWDVSPEIFREKMWINYQSFWNVERRQKANKINLSAEEVITLASIVQKETNKKGEYERVAGVYLNRLKKRMKLQADPTVIFALKKKTNNFNLVIKRVLLKDLNVKSAYNTYKNYGLPPGPIAMPDLNVIDAVLNAEKHNYLYFVGNPEKSGYHSFAKSLREHNNNRKKYTQWLNRNRVYR